MHQCRFRVKSSIFTFLMKMQIFKFFFLLCQHPFFVRFEICICKLSLVISSRCAAGMHLKADDDGEAPRDMEELLPAC